MLRTQTHFIQPFQKAMCLCAIGGLLCFGLPITVHAKSKVDVNAKLDPAYQKLLRSNTSKNIQNSKPCPKPNQRIPIKTPQDIEKLNKILQKSTTNTCHVVPAIDPSLRIPNDVVIKITKENFPLLQEIVLKVTKTNKTVPVTNSPSKKMTVKEFDALNNQIACNQKNGIVITDPLKKLPKCP
jgi:hypothetical protein